MKQLLTTLMLANAAVFVLLDRCAAGFGEPLTVGKGPRCYFQREAWEPIAQAAGDIVQ